MCVHDSVLRLAMEIKKATLKFYLGWCLFAVSLEAGQWLDFVAYSFVPLFSFMTALGCIWDRPSHQYYIIYIPK